jgi:hypothetical protein
LIERHRMNAPYRAYAPRPIRCLGVFPDRGFALKRYWIDLQRDALPQLTDWVAALSLAHDELPMEADDARPGVGFLILHRGHAADYLVLGWWDRQNELPLRVFVRYPGSDDAQWRAARGGESVCVWDLEVIGFEREAYVASYLAGRPADAAREAYLAAQCSRP